MEKIFSDSYFRRSFMKLRPNLHGGYSRHSRMNKNRTIYIRCVMGKRNAILRGGTEI